MTVAVTRTGGKLLKFMDAVFGLHESGILFDTAPTGGPPTYPDTLVS